MSNCVMCSKPTATLEDERAAEAGKRREGLCWAALGIADAMNYPPAGKITTARIREIAGGGQALDAEEAMALARDALQDSAHRREFNCYFSSFCEALAKAAGLDPEEAAGDWGTFAEHMVELVEAGRAARGE